MSNTDDQNELLRPEVLQRALKKQDRNEDLAIERAELNAFVREAEALGISRNDLETAASELRAERLADERQRVEKLRTYGYWTLGVLTLLMVWGLLRTPTADEPYSDDFTTKNWSSYCNTGTTCNLSWRQDDTQGTYAQFTVSQFRQLTKKYFANIRARTPPDTMKGYETMTFKAKGTGLDYICVYIRGDKKRRWRSPKLALTPTWTEYTVKLTDFVYQERSNKKSQWAKEDFEDFGYVDRVQFKLGTFVNDINSKGSVGVDDLEFK